MRLACKTISIPFEYERSVLADPAKLAPEKSGPGMLNAVKDTYKTIQYMIRRFEPVELHAMGGGTRSVSYFMGIISAMWDHGFRPDIVGGEATSAGFFVKAGAMTAMIQERFDFKSQFLSTVLPCIIEHFDTSFKTVISNFLNYSLFPKKEWAEGMIQVDPIVDKLRAEKMIDLEGIAGYKKIKKAVFYTTRLSDGKSFKHDIKKMFDHYHIDDIYDTVKAGGDFPFLTRVKHYFKGEVHIDGGLLKNHTDFEKPHRNTILLCSRTSKTEDGLDKLLGFLKNAYADYPQVLDLLLNNSRYDSHEMQKLDQKMANNPKGLTTLTPPLDGKLMMHTNTPLAILEGFEQGYNVGLLYTYKKGIKSAGAELEERFKYNLKSLVRYLYEDYVVDLMKNYREGKPQIYKKIKKEIKEDGWSKVPTLRPAFG